MRCSKLKTGVKGNEQGNKYRARVCACMLSRVQLFVTSWTVALQAPLSKEFSRQENLNGLSFPIPEELPDPGIEPTAPVLVGGFFTTELPGNPCKGNVK